jgi:polar amino acid transport system permease protein
LPDKKLKLGPLDLVLVILIAGFAVYLALRLKSGLNYNWNWAVIPQFLFRFDQDQGRWVAGLITQGLLTTIRLSIGACILATILGLAMGLGRVGRSLFNRTVGGLYVEMIRNLPPLVLVFIFYYFVSDQIMPLLGVEGFVRSSSGGSKAVLEFLFGPVELIPAFMSALITLAIYEGAYITEIVRAGVQSIERGQWEASSALGLNRFQQLRHIILPQAIRRILPPLAGQLISTIKDSAIVSIISIQELTFQGLELMSATYLTFEAWLVVGGLYLVLCLSLSLVVNRMELRLNRFQN